MVRRYEDRIVELEGKRALLAEKQAQRRKPKGKLDGTIRTAIAFLSNPLKLWQSDCLGDPNLTLRLVFASPLAYCRENGMRTADLTLPFKALANFDAEKGEMVEHSGIEPLTSCMPCRRSPN